MKNARIIGASTILVSQKGYDYTAGFLSTQLQYALSYMSKAKQKEFLAQFESTVSDNVTVKVKNCLSGKEVEIRWDQVGGPCDPSTERYHCM